MCLIRIYIASCSRKSPSNLYVAPRAALAHLTPPRFLPMIAQLNSIQPNPIAHPAQPNPSHPNPSQTIPGEVTLEDFIAFAEKKTWGQEESADPFNALLAATTNEAMLNNATWEGAGREETGAALGDECSDSDTEDARCGS